MLLTKIKRPIKRVAASHKVLLSVSFLCALTACSTSTSENNQPLADVPLKQPNVLLIMVDDLRTAIGAMGDERAITPNIDKLASEGAMFTRAYANIPVCGASRASMMTSIYPHKTRFVDYLANAEREVPNAVTLGQFFKQAGYHTISNGKVFHARSDSNQKSWSEPAWEPEVKGSVWYSDDSKPYFKATKRFGNRGPWVESADQPDEVYYDAQVKLKAVSDLQRLAKSDKPFFLATGFRRPHLPFNAPKKYFDLYEDTDFSPSALRDRPVGAPDMLKGSGEIHVYHFKDIEYNSDAFHRESLLGYYAAVSFIDQQVGDILATLDELELRDNTIVVFASDHGFHLGEYNFWGKHNMLNTALHIPFIVDAPNKTPGIASEALVSLVDVFPSLIELAGLPANDGIRKQLVGKSFAPLLDAPVTSEVSAAHQEFIYSRFKQGDSLVGQQLIYTEYEDDKGQQAAMLFDLSVDPDETMNVIDQGQYQPAVQHMSAQLKQIKQQAKAAKWGNQ